MADPNVWNTVLGPKSHRELPVALYDLAAECARRAIEEPKSGEATGLDYLVRLWSIGEAAELLVKSTLAGISASLIADKAATTATLYALTGSARRLQGKVSTIGALESVRRLNECKPPGSPGVTEPKLVFEIRNNAVHIGGAPNATDLEAALTELVTLVGQVFKVREALGQSHNWEAFWSPKHLKIVEARQKAGYERLLKHFQGLIKQANTSYDRLVAGLEHDARNRLIGELVTRAPDVDDDQILRSHTCPACQNTLWVVYDVEREIEVDDSDAPHSFGLVVNVRASVESATCPVCNLALTPEDLVLTDIPYALDLGVDEPTADEQEGWQDAQYGDEDRWAGYEPSPDDFEEPDDPG